MYLHPGGANKTISFSLVSLIPTSITLTWLLQSLQCMIWYTCDLPGIINNNNNNMMLDESWESEQQQLWWQMMMMTTGLIMNEMMNLKLWVIILGTLFIVDPRITVLQGKVLVHSSWWQGLSNTISTWKITIYLKCKIPRAGQLLNHFTWTSKCGSVIWINNIKKNSIYALICLRKIVFLSQDKHSLTILNSSSK